MDPEGRKPLQIEGARLAVAAEGAGECLMRFCLGVPESQPGDVPTDLEWLGGDLEQECWQTESVARGTADGVHWSSGNGLIAMSIVVPCDAQDDLAEPTHDAYRRLLDLAWRHGYDSLLRIWNYIPAINAGGGDAERYRRFCVGRSRALDQSGIDEYDLCAATAVGTHGERLIIHALAGRIPTIAIENPRQTSAYRYPRIHGPRSPSFARASAIGRATGEQALLISGTSSIVGHETIHPGDTLAQLDETILNLEALLGEAARRLRSPTLARFNDRSLLRVYLRDRTWADAVADRVRTQWPDVHFALVEADICRSDLMAEIEAFHTG